MKKTTLATVKKQFRLTRAYWLSSTDEKFISILTSSLRVEDRVKYKTEWVAFAIKRGLVRTEENGMYSDLYLTDKGVELAKEMSMRICAFTGKSV